MSDSDVTSKVVRYSARLFVFSFPIRSTHSIITRFKMSGLKLYFLQASRSIRTAWQLEELDLDYEVEFSPRVNKVAPPEFKAKAGDLGKFPTLVDNGLSVYESGAICEYGLPSYVTGAVTDDRQIH